MGTRRKAGEVVDLDNVKKLCITNMQEETCSFQWDIENYRKASEKEMEIRSSIFVGGPKYPHKWILIAIPKNEREELNGNWQLAIFLLLKKSGCEVGPVRARYQISIIDSFGRILKTNFRGPIDFTPDVTRHGFNMISSQELLDPATGFLQGDNNDTLKIHLDIQVDGELSHNTVDLEASSLSITNRNYRLLSEQLKSVMSDPSFSDISLTTPTKSFPASKTILAARSPVFRAMFLSENLESTTKIVEINDFPEEVVFAMLEWIYTGHTESLQENAMDLLRIGDKYGLDGLKEDCEQMIISNLTVENAVDVLALAHILNSNTLKPKIITFINLFKADVLRTESFQRMKQSNPGILLDLYTSA